MPKETVAARKIPTAYEKSERKMRRVEHAKNVGVVALAAATVGALFGAVLYVKDIIEQEPREIPPTTTTSQP